MKKKIPRLSLIIPCHNEEENIKSSITESISILNKLSVLYEIIIVDDGSTDKSGAIADNLAKKYKLVTVIHNPINLGQGISLLIGFKNALGELVLHNGVDSPFDLNDLPCILPNFPKYDIVCIARLNRDAYTPWRKFTSLANNLLRRIFFNIGFSDLTFVQIYKKSVLDSVSIKSRSAAFVTQELVIKALRCGYKINEIKLPYHKRKKGLPHHGKARDILWALTDLINLWFEIR